MSANLAPSSFFCPDYQNDLLDAYSVFLYSNDFASCFDHVSHMCEEFLDDTLSQTVLRCMSYGDSRFSNCLRTFFESLGKAIQVVAEAHNVIFHQLPINDALRSDISSITLAILFPLNIYGNLRPVINALMYLFLESSERTSSSLLSIKTYELPDAQCRAALLNQYEGLLGNKSGLLNISHLFDDRWLSFAKYILCARLEKFCSGRPTDGLLHHALDYKNRVLLLLWLPNLFHNQATLKANKDLLKDDMVYDAFYKVRRRDLFSVIIKYPKSIPALNDISVCLKYLNLRNDIISCLNNEIRKRLLHPGVHTEQLLLAYACLVRALRLVDPTFVIQEVVCRPLVTCLRKREDAVRCIVDELINNPSTRKNSEVAFLSCDRGGVELHRELMLPIPLEIEPLRDDNDESDTDMIAEDPNSDEFRRLTSDFEARFHSKVTSDNLHSKHEISLPKYKASCCSDSSESIFPSTFKQSNCYHLLQQSGSQLWASWQPDPIEARLQTGLRRNQLDLLSMLVSIYGSRRAFLVEYKQLLGQRLLQRQARASRVLTDACTPKWDTMDISVFDTSAEGTNLELLKLRFGESNLHECEVMLKDIRDSKCISNIVFECLQKGQEAKQPKQGLLQQSKDHAQSSMDSSIPTLSLDEISGACELTSGDRNIFPIVAYVLSAQYWPEFPEEHIKLPSSLAESFNYFKGCFEKIKSKRTVKWLHRIGYVDIDIELSCPENEGDMQSQSKRSRVVHNLEVTPLQAVILHLFTHHSRWTLRQLAQQVETQTSAVRRSLQLFIQLGFIREHSDQASESNKEKQGCQGAFDNQEIIFELAEPPSASELGTMEDGIISNKNRCFLSETSIMGGGNVPDGKSDSEYDEEDDGMDRIKEADAQTTAREKREKELQMAWPYIVAMLTNLGCLSIERIYMMLRMFMQGSANSPLGCSKDELREFLERRVRQGQITSDSGVYKLTARGND